MEAFSVFAYVAVLLLVALLSTRLMRVIKLPNVTGYIITGIIMGPFLFCLLFNNFSFENIKDGIDKEDEKKEDKKENEIKEIRTKKGKKKKKAQFEETEIDLGFQVK